MLLSALLLALPWSLSLAVLTPLSAVDDDNDCALYLSGPGRTSSYDYSLNLLRGNFGYEGQHTCITYDAVNRAYLEARKRILVAQPKGDWTPEDYASVGELILDISTNIARTYGLSYEEIEKGLPLIDTSRTLIREVCPPVFSHVECRAGKYRRLDGLCNNLEHPTWGAINAPFQRLIGPLYADGINSPRVGHSGRDLPLSRVVSRTMHPDEGLHEHAGTVMIIAWGQFMDHDYTLTATPLDPRNRNDPEECCERPPHQKHPYCNEIRIPDDDYFYRLFGMKCMNFVRAFPSPRPGCRLGSRTPFNTLTGVIDGNTVYGVTEKFGRKLRTGYGGLLRMNPIFKEYGLKDLLPLKLDIPDEGCTRPNKNMFCFEGGEIRVNEQLVLTVMHTLMAREHNRVAVGLTSVNPHWDDETLYQESRRIVIAQIQHITYNEFLPILLGKDVMEKFGLVVAKEGYWDGYDPTVNPDVIASFAAAAYRFGHSLLPTAVERWSKAHKFIASKRLSELIRRPYDLYRAGVLDEYVMGLMNQVAQAMDDSITQEVTNHLFKKVGSRFGMDLVSFNMQRGREFGIPGYMEFRKFCGLPWTDDFQGLFGSMPNETVRKYEKIFEHPVDVDLWSGGVSEKPLPGSMLGPTFACIIATQFSYSRRGDRFWYELPNQPSSFTPEQLQEVRKGRMARIICDNTDIIDTVQLYPMVLPDHELNPRIPCKSGILPSIDFSKWAETPPFSGAAKQFITRAFVRELNVIANITTNSTNENTTTETTKQNQTVAIENQIQTLQSSTTLTTTARIPREDINQILNILTNTTKDKYSKEPLQTAENNIINATATTHNCSLTNCDSNITKEVNNAKILEKQNMSLENNSSNTNISVISKNTSDYNINSIERHRRSDLFNNNNEPLKAPLLLNYEVPHIQKDQEELLPPGVIKGSADFNIETLHDDPIVTTTQNIFKSNQYQQAYHRQEDKYESQPNRKIIDSKGYKNQNPVHVKYHNHDGKVSHEYVVLHDPSEINDHGNKQKNKNEYIDYEKKYPMSEDKTYSRQAKGERKNDFQYSSDAHQSKLKKHDEFNNNNNEEDDNDSNEKNPPTRTSQSKYNDNKSSQNNEEDESYETHNSKEKYEQLLKKENDSRDNNKDYDNNGSSEETDEKTPYQKLHSKDRNERVKNYEKIKQGKKSKKSYSDSKESTENQKIRPLSKERFANDDESEESYSENKEKNVDSRESIETYKETPSPKTAKYKNKPLIKGNRQVYDEFVKPHYYEDRTYQDRTSHTKEKHDPTEKDTHSPYKKERQSYQNKNPIQKENYSRRQQYKSLPFTKTIYDSNEGSEKVPFRNTKHNKEETIHEKKIYDNSNKHRKTFTNKYNDKNIKPLSKDRHQNQRYEDRSKNGSKKRQYDHEINSNDDDSSDKDKSIHYKVESDSDDSSENKKNMRGSREHNSNKENSREYYTKRDESSEDKSIGQPKNMKNSKENYEKYNSRSQEDNSESVEEDSRESIESNAKNNQNRNKSRNYEKNPLSQQNRYTNDSDETTDKPQNTIQDIDLSDFSHERIQLNKKGEVEPALDIDEYNERSKSDKNNGNQKSEQYQKYDSDDSLEYKNNPTSEKGNKVHINDGEIKPVIEIGHESSSSSEEKDSNEKNNSDDLSLEDFLRKGTNAKTDDDSQTNIKPVQIKEDPNVKQQVERIPLNYKHEQKYMIQDNQEQKADKTEELLNDHEPETVTFNKPNKEVHYDENLKYKFDDVKVKLPEIKLPEDILDFNYEESFYEPEKKSKNEKIFRKDDNKRNNDDENNDDDEENEDGVHHLRHHKIDDDERDSEQEREHDADDGHDHHSYDYTSSPYKKKEQDSYDYISSPYKKKEKDEVKDDNLEEFDYKRSPFARQQEADQEEEDLYEKFVRERFGRRKSEEQKSGHLHHPRILPTSPVLYQNLQKFLDKTKNTMKEAEMSGDPNAGYAWTLEYAEPLVEI